MEYPVRRAGSFVEESNGCTIRYGTRPPFLGRELRLEQKGSEVVVCEPQGTTAYKGTATPAKEMECVLTFDEKTQTYELRPLEFNVRVSAPAEPENLLRTRGYVQATEGLPQKAPPPVEKEEDEDDFGDLASALADELGGLSNTIAGTAGALGQEEEDVSEEE